MVTLLWILNGWAGGAGRGVFSPRSALFLQSLSILEILHHIDARARAHSVSPRLLGQLLTNMFDWIVNFVSSNPMLVAVILYMIYKQYQARQPWPDYGGRAVSVHSLAEWNDVLSTAGGRLVVADFYATCKSRPRLGP